MAQVTLRGIEKRFGQTRVLSGVDIDVPDGGFAVLVGPSGCGKSTLLRLIAGLEEADGGSIRFGDREVTRLPPRDRDIAMVFQSYALYPHLTVRDNLAFGLELRKTAKAEIEKRIAEASEMLGLDPLLARFPRQLSGGQRQRVAMGRAIVRRAQVFLFDEPLSNLDAALRAQVRVDIKKLHDRIGATTVYVTHDQVEAMTLADRIFVLNRGRVEQSGPPLEVYARPATRFVAAFLGSPAMNFVDAELEQQGGRWVVRAPGVSLRPSVSALGDAPRPGKVVLGLRPHDVAPPEEIGKESAGEIHAEVDVLEALGTESFAHCRVGELPFVARLPGSSRPAKGSALLLGIATEHVHVFDAEGGRALWNREG
ncbi:MAG: sn-glycerol-3-phosphate ABC transporter ATP-binding protein UgpC [Myxococcales bacterium]|nr:sn-glycerol-3-phosphate ABC transporter ATP-binding protein UgpC [Myxococcales bacterium]